MHFIITIAKGYIVFILFVLFNMIYSTAHSQSIRAYSFGSIGNAGSIKPMFSGSFYLQSSACILVENGIKVFQESKDGNFTNYCETTIFKKELISLIANPNPVSTYTYIKFKEVFLIEQEEKVSMQIINSHGIVVNEYSTTLSALNYGFKLQLNDRLNNGVYFLKLNTPNKLFKTLTLIKNK